MTVTEASNALKVGERGIHYAKEVIDRRGRGFPFSLSFGILFSLQQEIPHDRVQAHPR